MQERYDYLLKMLIIGDQAVGKTCLLLHFSEEKFASNHIATIGIDFKVKILPLNGKTVKLQIWDTAGQERFRNITQTYYRGAMGVILAYDCTNRDSFNHVRDWMQQIHAHANPDIVKVLVANKIDMLNDRKVSTEEGKTLAEQMNVRYFEASAKTGYNVEKAFTSVAREIIDSGLCEKYGYPGVKVNLKAAGNRKLCCN